MKRYTYLILLILTGLVINSCALEDDLNEMFYNRTWYIVGGKLNGTELNSEVKGFYANGSEGYKFVFQTESFAGELTKGDHFSGTWHVNGKNRTISFNIKNEAEASSNFDHNVYTVIRDIKYYKGDCNYLQLFADKDNYLRLNYER